MKKLTGITVLIWDFDKTFYPLNIELEQAIREAEFQVLCKHTGWTRTKAEEEFYKLYKIVYQSATKTCAVLTNMSIVEINDEIENLYDRRKFIKKDPQIIELFQNLSQYRQLILMNGVKARIKQTLVFLGLDPNIFEAIITPEDTGVTKPNPDAFKFILKLTKLSPSQHLMIGDRERVDLEPAQKLGMKTCLVWSDKKSEFADIVLPDVYKLAEILE